MKKELYDKIEKVYYKDYLKNNKYIEVMFLLGVTSLLISSFLFSTANIFYGACAVILTIAYFEEDKQLTQKEKERKLDMDELLKEVKE